MPQPTPREFMQASLVCLVLAASVLHWSPELSGYLVLLANGLACLGVLPPKPRVVLSTSIENISPALVAPTPRFRSDVMERLAEGASYTSSTRRRFLP